MAAECSDSENKVKCKELGWNCIPLAVEMYVAWSQEAKQTFSQLV